MFDNQSVLITGGTGSFGKKMVEQILKEYQPKKLIIFSRDELKQYEMAQKFSPAEYDNLRYFIGDVRDQERLYEAFHNIDYVIHAAAIKQVPIAEYNPFEAIKTNVLGAQNVIRAAIRMKVKKVIALSTDKAASPVNLYGASKLCSDKLFIAGNAMSGDAKTKFSVVRYGNVFGSRGSVVPLFIKQKEHGVISITDKRMTRFSITLKEGVDFVIRSLREMIGGEIFVPKIPSYRICDLARAIAPEVEINYVGIRPGEKLHELMIPVDEARHTVEYKNHYVIQPDFLWWGKEHYLKNNGGVVCEEGFSYQSDQNDQWLSIEDINKLIQEYFQY